MGKSKMKELNEKRVMFERMPSQPFLKGIKGMKEFIQVCQQFKYFHDTCYTNANSHIKGMIDEIKEGKIEKISDIEDSVISAIQTQYAGFNFDKFSKLCDFFISIAKKQIPSVQKDVKSKFTLKKNVPKYEARLTFYEEGKKFCEDAKKYVSSDKYKNVKNYFEAKLKKYKTPEDMSKMLGVELID